MEKKYQIRIPRVSLSSSGSSNRSCQQTNSSKTTDMESGESEPEAVCSRGYSQRAEMYTVRKAPKIGGSISTSSTSASSSATSNRSNYVSKLSFSHSYNYGLSVDIFDRYLAIHIICTVN